MRRLNERLAEWSYRRPSVYCLILLAVSAAGCAIAVIWSELTWHGALWNTVRGTVAIWSGAYFLMLFGFIARYQRRHERDKETDRPLRKLKTDL